MTIKPEERFLWWLAILPVSDAIFREPEVALAGVVGAWPTSVSHKQLEWTWITQPTPGAAE